jgi:hypothetical protein
MSLDLTGEEVRVVARQSGDAERSKSNDESDAGANSGRRDYVDVAENADNAPDERAQDNTDHQFDET